MRHYEVVLMIHADRSEKVVDIINHYKNIVSVSGGKVHRLEDWGRRPLAYPIKKLRKAHYILMNIEVVSSLVNDLESSFRFSDVIIRSMIIRVKCAITEPSPIIKIIRQEYENNVYNKRIISSS